MWHYRIQIDVYHLIWHSRYSPFVVYHNAIYCFAYWTGRFKQFSHRLQWFSEAELFVSTERRRTLNCRKPLPAGQCVRLRGGGARRYCVLWLWFRNTSVGSSQSLLLCHHCRDVLTFAQAMGKLEPSLRLCPVRLDSSSLKEQSVSFVLFIKDVPRMFTACTEPPMPWPFVSQCRVQLNRAGKFLVKEQVKIEGRGWTEGVFNIRLLHGSSPNQTEISGLIITTWSLQSLWAGKWVGRVDDIQKIILKSH